MGNKTTRSPFQSINNDSNWTGAEQREFENMLWITDRAKFDEEYAKFKAKSKANSVKDIFPRHSEFCPLPSDETISDDKRLLNEIFQRMTYGFTTSEKKLHELHEQGKLRSFSATFS